jgi:AraC family transcriptional regulator, ethanolamine operon transcriptional activator
MDRTDDYPNCENPGRDERLHSSHFEQHSYSGFEPSQAFDIVYGGHFEHRLLSPKRATMQHQRLVVGDVRIETGAYDFPVIAQGAMPPDTVCIGFVAEGAEITRYNTEEIRDDEIQIYGASAELMYHAMGPSRWINFTAPQGVLQRLAQERCGRPLRLPQREVASARLNKGTRAYLGQLALDAFSLAGVLQPGGIGEVLAGEMSRAFVTAYADALSTAEERALPSRTSTAQRHYHLILACERLVLRSGMVDIKLAEVARRSGYSLRSLELIFRRSVGMPPDRYFMNMRLNGALRDLVAAGPGCSVTEVATRWGFKHLSRFAEHYRRAFGELPSQSLARSNGRGGRGNPLLLT